MKKKKLYIFVIIAIVLFLIFFSRVEKGVEVETWGVNRSINWEWNFEF